MARIHPTATVDPGADIADGASIGPYCVIGPHVRIAEGCELVAHVHVTGHTSIGMRTRIQPFVSLGTPPQSVKYRGGPTRLVVGADCDLRECVTMNTGTEEDGGLTSVGDKCFFMVHSHVGHDCRIGNNVTCANNVMIAGHVHVGDNVTFGGGAGVRQFSRIGEGVMVAGLSAVRADVIPNALVHDSLVGLNIVGMRRRGHSKAAVMELRRSYDALFFGAGTFRERLAALEERAGDVKLVADMIAFIRAGKRPLTMAVNRADGGGDL